MKILISGVMMAALVATTANAAITVEQRKAACEKNADKVWVEDAETCIPKNPCDDEKFKSYCYTKLANINVASPEVAKKLVQLEFKETSCEMLDVTYLACKYRNNFGASYIVYKFASMDEKDSDVARQGENAAVCKIYDGIYNSKTSSCYLNGSPAQMKRRCDEIAQRTNINASFDSVKEMCIFK